MSPDQLLRDAFVVWAFMERERLGEVAFLAALEWEEVTPERAAARLRELRRAPMAYMRALGDELARARSDFDVTHASGPNRHARQVGSSAAAAPPRLRIIGAANIPSRHSGHPTGVEAAGG